MQHLNKLFGLVTGVVASMISLNVSAQDMGCGNCADYGTYRLGTQTAIINHYFGCPNCNDADPNGAYNFIGGSNSQDFTGSGSQVAENSIAYGDGARVGGNQSVAFGENVDNPEDNAFVFGKSITALGLETFTVGWSSVEFGISSGASTIPEGVFMAEPQSGKVGIGTTSPGNAKLTIEGNGGSSSTNPALLIKDAGSNRRLNLRNDGWTGLSNDPGAPYYFTETNKSPFQAGTDGEANIVQNYRGFPFFKNQGPTSNSTKWLALGERPPANGSNQVAYGLTNVWDDYAANFTLLKNFNDTTKKNAAITFQDVGPQGNLTTDGGRNRLRFLFRNSKEIQQTNSKFELMSLEPTGQVGIGDFSGSQNPKGAKGALDIRSEGNGTDIIFNVRRDVTNTSETALRLRGDGNFGVGEPSPSARLVTKGSSTNSAGFAFEAKDGASTNPNTLFAVRNDGLVGVSRTSQVTTTSGVDFTVNGRAEKNTPGNGTWTTPSDKRLKKNIKPFEDGLNTLMQIEPKRFELNAKYGKREGKEGIGVIAQEIREVAPYMVYGEEKEDEYLGYSANALWYILVNAVKEQQQQIKEEKDQKESFKQEVEDQLNQLKEKVEQLADQQEGNANRFKNQEKQNLNKRTVSIGEDDNAKKAMLLQNRPNPYSGETVIPYYLPKDFESANLLITSTNGQVIKRVTLKQAGKSELTLRTEGLNAGQYLYSLIVDGQKMQTRKMVLNKN